MGPRPIDLRQLIVTLGIQEFWNFKGVRNDQGSINKRLVEIKVEVKKHFKKLARIHHPDRGGNEEKFKELSAAYTIFKKLRLVRQQPPPVRRRVTIIHMGNYGAGFGGTSSASTSDGTYTTGGVRWKKM